LCEERRDLVLPLNAGKGAVFAADGRDEMDAAILDGATVKTGALARISGRSSIRSSLFPDWRTGRV